MPAKPPGKGDPVRAAKVSGKKCPICRRPASGDTMPFCSPRCRNVDLNGWLSNSYVIPASDNDDEDAE